MDWLYSLLDNSSVPVVTALILGILTAVSPCPLATNLTAVAYLGREMVNRRRSERRAELARAIPSEEEEDEVKGLVRFQD